MLNSKTRSSKARLSFGAGALLAGLFAGQAVAQTAEELMQQGYLLPNMMPWISGEDRNGYTHDWRINSSLTEFSATTTPLNAGLGHLDVWDDPSQRGDNDIDVYQRIFHENGVDFIDILAGNFINHPSHGHFHFEGYSIQQLRHVTEGNGIGEVAAAGEKTSFCMIDLDQFQSGTSSNYFGCGRGHQGISAGWGDIYSSGLSGQQIDISGLERSGSTFTGGAGGGGLYWLEVTIDPLNSMIESNNNDNSAFVLIDLNQEGVELDDHSNSKASATWLNHGDYRFGEINWEGDVDQFSADVVEGARYVISMTELQLHRGDMTVYDTTGTNQVFYENIGQTGQQTTEYIFRANGTGDYYVEIGETENNFGTRDGSYLLHWELLAIAGDVDEDGVVDITDLDLIFATWGDSVAAGTAGDFDANGTIGAGDLAILHANWGATLADYGVHVPEPGSMALLAMGGLALLRRRRR